MRQQVIQQTHRVKIVCVLLFCFVLFRILWSKNFCLAQNKRAQMTLRLFSLTKKGRVLLLFLLCLFAFSQYYQVILCHTKKNSRTLFDFVCTICLYFLLKTLLILTKKNITANIINVQSLQTTKKRHI